MKIKYLKVSNEAVITEHGIMQNGYELKPEHPLFKVIVDRKGYHEPGEVSPKPFEVVYEDGF